MSKTAHIIYVNYLNQEGTELSIGGIQTYISNLTELLVSLGYQCNIYQKSSISFQKLWGDANVYGVTVESMRPKRIGENLFKEFIKHYDKEQDILIFGCDNYICNTKGIPFIAIQHGITWDRPQRGNKCYWMLKKFYRGWLTVNRVEKANLLVCVDNNFINWYRATVPTPNVKMINIPNFTEIAPEFIKPKDDKIRIMFARRFFEYRGTRIFAKAIKKLLNEYQNLQVTFAGSGSDEEWLKKFFINDHNIKFITYSSEETLEIHKDKDIAVVPTLGSEGTSLSLLEAMSAQCAVVCTNVGGMTNIVLDGYNGLIVNPDEHNIYKSILSLIEDIELRRRLAINGYEVVKDCFSKSIWCNKWKEVILKFTQEYYHNT